MRTVRGQGGFTIIEVMLVVTIIGVLAAIVLPAAQSYAVRAKTAEAILVLTNCRTVVSAVFSSSQTLPGANGFGCESATQVSQYVQSIHTSEDGTIAVVLRGFNDPAIDNHEVTMAPLDSAGQHLAVAGQHQIAQWRCGAILDGTTVSGRYLPGTCKGI